MKNNLRKIKAVLKKYKGFEVTPELNNKILKSIDDQAAKNGKKAGFLSLTKALFVFKGYFIPLIMALVIFAGFVYFNQNSYSYYLDKAERGQQDLADLISYNTDRKADETDEPKIQELGKEIVFNTEGAMNDADNLTDPGKLYKALDEINKVQDRTVAILSDAMDSVSGNDVILTLTQALNQTAREQVMMAKATNFVQNAQKNGEGNINIELAVADPGFPEGQPPISLSDARKQYEDVKKTIEGLKAQGADSKQIGDLEIKLTSAEDAFKKNNIDLACGILTATQATCQNIIVKSERGQ